MFAKVSVSADHNLPEKKKPDSSCNNCESLATRPVDS